MKAATFLDNFERLAETPNGIPKLRELILQFAVQGKLVAQDPSDESASVLMAIAAMSRNSMAFSGSSSSR